MNLKTIRDFNLKGKKVLLRVDLNSPVVRGKVLDNPRFKEAAITIRELIKRGAKVAIIAHQGRKGDRDFLDLKQHSRLLSKHSGKKIDYIDSLFEKNAEKRINELKESEVILLKNVRCYKDEKNIYQKNDAPPRLESRGLFGARFLDARERPRLESRGFQRSRHDKNNRYERLCGLFDVYVNDAFSVSHRKQGSIILPPKYLPSCAGLNFEKEIKALDNFKINKSNAVFLIGGAKVEDYIPIFNVLKNKNNILLASGVLANLFFVAKGINLGYENKWLKENDYVRLVPELKKLLKKYDKQIVLPVDFAFGSKLRIEKPLEDAPFESKIWDVGHETILIFKGHIKGAKIIFMKGPLGFSEIPIFSYPTVEILKEISNQSKLGAFSLLGGGHLTATIQKYKIPNNFSYMSTSGGALIAYISGEKLPGIDALEKAKEEVKQ